MIVSSSLTSLPSLMLQIKFTLPHWQPEDWHDHISAGTLVQDIGNTLEVPLDPTHCQWHPSHWASNVKLTRAEYIEHHPSPSVGQSVNFIWELHKFTSSPLVPADIILERCTSLFPPWPCQWCHLQPNLCWQGQTVKTMHDFYVFITGITFGIWHDPSRLYHDDTVVLTTVVLLSTSNTKSTLENQTTIFIISNIFHFPKCQWRVHTRNM